MRTPRPDQGAATDPIPDVLITGSTRDPLTPFALVAGDPFLSGMGDACSFDVVGHTTYADPTSRQLILDFLTSGAQPC